ncbi:MAG: alpha-amylase [Calditrichaeota bacterium]|nr:alpha-amylase [Calditrichota bacterium]
MDFNFMVEFHPNRKAREQFELDESLFNLQGDIVFLNMRATRTLAERLREINSEIRASELNALGLLHEIEHYMIRYYFKNFHPELYDKLENHLIDSLGRKEYQKLLKKFCELFPPTEVFNNKTSVNEYLKNKTESFPNRFILLEEIVVLWLDNLNPAFASVETLIDPSDLEKVSAFDKTFDLIDDYFKEAPKLPKQKISFLDFLRQPAQKYPQAVLAQLEFIRIHWREYIGAFLDRILKSMDFIKEEQKARFDKATFGPGPSEIPDFKDSWDLEPERFSRDEHWMPRLVLIAKSTYVWLDQLSKKYHHDIRRLDEIPDEELERLAKFGITGLWLIGIWERSRASQKIKQRTGNPEALASAYSLYDYVVAHDLGGEEALNNLKERAWKYGIRMATDMVPNHTGIDSKWIVEHPDWFVQLPYSPFPKYSFNGPDLCDHPDIGVFIEDGYWDRTDAAVVFKWVHYHSGEVRYIYHGNDGTSMPWNDTAQLNYLNPQVREAVIQKILEIARQFPVIRFDAAMTLTKKHFQRLWFPEPGSGGDIPSRAEFSMTRQEFDRQMPHEFWREVVDRIQQEVPDTLLLAEAFWLMESYFVRTLGMHRVYNSAFMNMLKNEENQKFRQLIKNVLEFNPQILKRYVNFMNNPDEETAATQFGKGDKYFGVCTLLATMPGLPMFGHGQLEGFSEKYGMEYRRAYWDEEEDTWLVHEHFRLIAPLLRKRYLFSEVNNFILYDVFTDQGNVNENVIAYSNRFSQESALVIYNNSYNHASGWIKMSAAFRENDQLIQKSLAEGLGLSGSDEAFVVFKDHISKLEFIRKLKELKEKGLFVDLGGYKYQVYYNFKIVEHSPQMPYQKLYQKLAGKGVLNLNHTLKEIHYEPLHRSLDNLLNFDFFQSALKIVGEKPRTKNPGRELLSLFKEFCNQAAEFEKSDPVPEQDLKLIIKKFNNFFKIYRSGYFASLTGSKSVSARSQRFVEFFSGSPAQISPDLKVFYLWLALMLLKLQYKGFKDFSFISERLFDQIFQQHLDRINEAGKPRKISLKLLLILTLFPEGFSFADFDQINLNIENLLSVDLATEYLKIHPFEGVYYFNKEHFEELMFWLFLLHAVSHCSKPKTNCKKILEELKNLEILFEEAFKAGYRLYDFIDRLKTFSSVDQRK